ncbi:hypothetical protein PIB30_056099 [Stylosanthes scabra]|uniref:Uncharacterized protein n=1 Tax=Stylosanthes scabra TaxID=79078 RepID=A0ABU6XJK7_9FABA|nr:hypothetical protein [Stylosanthes scabra]
MYPKDSCCDGSFQKWAHHTQVVVGARDACYHDEIKLFLPVMWAQMHHLLFSFFYVDMQTKFEALKPVHECHVLMLQGCIRSCGLRRGNKLIQERLKDLTRYNFSAQMLRQC